MVLLSCLHGDGQPIRRRGQRAHPARLVRAGRVVGEVEVEHELAVVFPEIRTFHRVEHVAAAAVGLAPAGRVAEAEKEAAAVALEPVELQGQLLATQSLRDTFFGGTGLDASLNAGASGFFGASGSANRQLVINALVTNAVGNATPASASAVRGEVDSLLTRIPTLNAGATVSQATVAACTAVLGSAAVTLQ